MIKANGDRPKFLKMDGWTEFVAVHDEQYLLKSNEWRQKLAAAHPDRGGAVSEFRRLGRGYANWKADEKRYYERLGLTPPMRSSRKDATNDAPLADDVLRFGPYARTISGRLRMLLSDGKWRTSREIADAVKTRVGTVHTILHRIARKGHELEREEFNGEMFYRASFYARSERDSPMRLVVRLLSDGQEHKREDIVALCGGNDSAAMVVVCRLRKRGLDIVTIRNGQKIAAYQWRGRLAEGERVEATEHEQIGASR